MSQTKTGKTAASKNSKPVSRTAAASPRNNTTKTAPPAKTFQPIKPKQRRELWVLSCLALTVLLSLAAFVKEGILVSWLHRLTLGLMGYGAYLAPFAAFADMLVIIFARGKPVGRRITAISLMPFLCSTAIHMLLSRADYSFKHCGMLYSNGIRLLSGGFISGGFAELAVSVFSRIGGLILMLLLLAADILIIWDLKFIDVVDFFLDWYDERRSQRLEAAAAERENELYTEPEHTAPPIRKAPETSSSRQRPARQEMIELPVDEVPIPAQPHSHVNSRRPVSRTPDLPLDPIPPTFEDDIPDMPDASDQPMRLPDDAPADEHFNGGTASKRESVPSEPPVYAKTRWGKEPEELDDDLPPWEEPVTVEAQDAFEPEPPEIPEEVSPAAPPQRPVPQSPAPSEPPSDGSVTVVDTHMQERTVASDLPIVMTAESAPGRLPYQFPPVSLLKEPVNVPTDDATQELRERSRTLADTLTSFGISAQITGVIRGPSVTRYELQLDRGVKLSRLTSLQNDIALALGASGIRIAPIPDKQAVGIEVPNKVVQTVYMREVLLSQNMTDQKSKLSFALGRDITGESVVADIHKMPHLLIAGTTGSGKSVCINSIIVSLLYRTTPEEVRFIMIDPKMVELRDYDGIPHLLIPVVTDYKKAPGTLAWAVAEMERRYKLMSESGARELSSYNEHLKANGEQPLPRIVIIIDELADLMMVAAKDIEEAICRIAQKARAAGMHLIIATQRPSADVLTGLMKSNIPSRIAFAVASQVESRIILDQGGADKLIGRGDMLFSPLGASKPRRIQGCFLSDGEIEKITSYIKEYNQPDYSEEIIEQIESAGRDQDADMDADDEGDPMLGDAIDVVMETGQASASMLQRKLKLGYARAARIIDQMESRGIIGPYDGSRPRQIMISKLDWQEMKMRYGVRS